MAASQADPDVPKITNIIEGEQIGSGASGSIFKGNWLGSPCAIKKVHEILRSNQVTATERNAMLATFQRECEQSIRLRHPNIVQFFGIYRTAEDRLFPSLVMELLHCSLSSLVTPDDKSVIPPVMPLQMKISLMCDVARGLRYLHGHTPRAIIHRDLSSNNVLVSSNMVAKIGDLGTMRFLNPQRQSQMSKAPGTVVFMPPEALVDNAEYSKDIDVFSFACVFLHTLSGEWPFPSQPTVPIPGSSALKAVSEADRRKKFLDGLKDGELTVKDDNTKKDIKVKELIVKCLNNNRKERPEIIEVSQDLEAFYNNIPHVLPLTKLHAWLTIQERSDCIKTLENDVKFRDDQIAELQVLLKTNFIVCRCMNLNLCRKR